METHKLRFLHSLLQHSEMMGCGDLRTYIEMVKNKETQIRDSYAEHIPMPSDEFVRMILVDSIFVLQFLCFRDRTNIMAKIFYKDIENDLQLAENQLPFFILVDIFRVALKPVTKEKSFTYRACCVFDVNKSRVETDPITKEATTCFHLLDLLRTHYLPSPPKIGTNNRDDEVEKWQQRIQARCCHLLNFLRRSHYLPSHQDANTTTEPEEIGMRSIWCPTAMSLREAGVKFRVSKKKPCSLLDIHFDEEEGILTIPPFLVEDVTEWLHRNLIAFEQFRYWNQTRYIADYFAFLDCLINTREDVNLLVKAGIIDNWLGSEEEVAHLINSLTSHIYMSDEYYYAPVMKQLNNHRNKRWNCYRATLKHTYFKHPWAVLSVIYAIFLLLLTIGQFVTGILAVPGVKK